jgi:hypothetical protein
MKITFGGRLDSLRHDIIDSLVFFAAPERRAVSSEKRPPSSRR